MEDADGPVAAMPSWKRPRFLFLERSRPYLSPTISTPKLHTTRHWWHVTRDYTMKAAGIAGGTGLHKASTSHTWSWFCTGTTETTGKYSGLKSILQAKLHILLEGCWFPKGRGWFFFNQVPNKHWQTKPIKYITSSQFQIIPQQKNAVLTGFVLCFFRGQKVIALRNSAFN